MSVSSMLYKVWLSLTFIALGYFYIQSGYAADTTTDENQTPAATQETSAFTARLEDERKAKELHFALTPHKQNYLMLTNTAGLIGQGETLQPWELKFQVSFKVSVLDELLGGNLQFGYTQQSFWQAFNSTISSPFRETNYEPELMWQYLMPRLSSDQYSRAIVLGLSHQSNGQTQPVSRSWNRIYLNFIFEYEDFYFSLKPWYRIPEPAKSNPTDAQGDDNPDIDHYMGTFELTSVWSRRDGGRLGLLFRNNLQPSDLRGAIQIDWSFPIKSKLKGYVQYFNGYGESLIDYNHSLRRLGVGLMLNNWL